MQKFMNLTAFMLLVSMLAIPFVAVAQGWDDPSTDGINEGNIGSMWDQPTKLIAS